MAPKDVRIVSDQEEDLHPYSSTPVGRAHHEMSAEKSYDLPHGWLVCMAGFLIQAWIFGVVLNFTIFFVPFQEEFGAAESTVSWIGSLQWCMFLIGPLCSLVVVRMGSTIAICLGAVIMCAGFIASSLATDIYQLYFAYGLLIGCGMGLPFLAAYTVLGDHFRRHLRLATVVITIGGGVGIFGFAELFTRLIEIYGWRGCLLLNAGIALHLVPLGMICASRRRDPSERIPGLRQMLGVQVFRIGKYRWMLLHMFLWNLGLNVMFIQLVKIISNVHLEYPSLEEIPISGAISVAVIQGVFNTVGRCLAIIPLLFPRYFDIMKVYAVCATLMGAFQIVLIVCSTQVGFTLVASGVALNFGLMLCYIVPVFIELVGIENISAALGYSNLCQGVGGMCGPPLIGALVHGVRIFLAGGIFTLFGGFAAAVAVFMHFRQASRQSKKDMISVENGVHDEHTGYELAGSVQA